MQTAADLWVFLESLPEINMGVGAYLVVSVVAIIVGFLLLVGNPTKGG